MATIEVNGRFFSCDLIIFDKDGTLIDLHYLWSQKIEAWMGALQSTLPLPERFADQFFAQVGYDAAAKRLLPDTPAAVGSMAEFETIATFAVYQTGVSWSVAAAAVRQTAVSTLAAPPTRDQLRPMGNVRGLFDQCRKAGVRIAIVTNDNRAGTEAGLQLLGWSDYVEVLLCGDDPVPNKPAPDGIWQIAEQTAVLPERMLMVGDATHDMLFGRNGGVAGCIGIGDETQPELTAVADCVVPTVDALSLQ